MTHTRIRIRSKHGFVMLMTVLILGTLLLAVTVIGSLTSIKEGQENIGYQNKQFAKAVATGCMEHALNQLARNATYAGNEIYTIGTVPCTIYPITISGGNWIIGVQVDMGIQTAKLKTTLTSQAPIRIGSWQEVSALP